MEIAVAGMEHVAHAQSVRGDDLVHSVQNVRQARPRDDAIQHHVGGRDAAVGTERRLAALPQQLALGLVGGGANLARTRIPTCGDDALGLGVQTGSDAVDLDQQGRRRIAWIAAAERVLHRLDGELVDHFHGRRHQAARNDRRHRRGGLIDLVEHREHGLDGSRLAEVPHDDLGCDAEGAFGADEHAGQVVAQRLARATAQPHDLAVGHDDLEAQNVIDRHAVLQRVRPTGVVGDVSPDGAGLLAGGIRRVVEALGTDRPRQVEIDQPGLDHRDLVVVVHLEHAIHPHQRQDDAALGGQTAAGETGAGAAGHERQSLAAGEADDRRHLLGRRGEHDKVRQRAEEREAIRLVHQELVGLREHAARTHDALELTAERGLAIGGESGHGDARSIPC